MAHWLLKEEPKHYSYDDLARDRKTQWEGIHNALALRHLRAMRPGDLAFFYHTGEERAIVGIVRVSGHPHPDPSDDRGSWAVEIRPVRPLEVPIALTLLKRDASLARFDLVRISRLSVVPVSAEQWSRILSYEAGGPSVVSPKRRVDTLGQKSKVSAKESFRRRPQSRRDVR